MTTTATSTTTPAAALDPIPIEFNAARHEYRVRGLLFPSVTTILHELGAIDDRYYTEECARRGDAVHLATAAIDQQLASPADFPDDIQPYLESWVQLKRMAGIEILRIEDRVASIEYGYAGTVDRIARIGKQHAVLDFKTGGKERWHALQTAAYAACPILPGVPLLHRFAVYLRRNGAAALLDPHTNRNDIAVFRAGVLFANWLRKTA